jgi:hypothetical protein
MLRERVGWVVGYCWKKSWTFCVRFAGVGCLRDAKILCGGLLDVKVSVCWVGIGLAIVIVGGCEMMNQRIEIQET